MITVIKERPIIFSAPVVRAILEGRKTQTRRVVKDNAKCGVDIIGENGVGVIWDKCPYGQPGDMLWVRETFGVTPGGSVVFKADYSDSATKDFGWKPSIHMPRKASRITLEITGVRVERLQNISNADVNAEGVIQCDQYTTLRHSFGRLWESINGAGSWNQNPWVWVIEFKRISL